MIARLGSRAWMLAGLVVAVLILALAWLVVISPARSDASQLRSDTASVQTQNTVIQAQNNKLRDQAKNQQQLVAELQAALSGLPSGAGLPVFSRQLATQAAARGLSLTGVAIGTPLSPTTGTAVSSDPTAAGTTSDTTAAAAPVAIPITVNIDGPALQQLQFLRDVQQVGPRLALVTSTALSPAQDGSGSDSIDANATMTLQVTVFTSPLPKQTREQLATLSATGETDDTSDDSADQG